MPYRTAKAQDEHKQPVGDTLAGKLAKLALSPNRIRSKAERKEAKRLKRRQKGIDKRIEQIHKEALAKFHKSAIMGNKYDTYSTLLGREVSKKDPLGLSGDEKLHILTSVAKRFAAENLVTYYSLDENLISGYSKLGLWVEWLPGCPGQLRPSDWTKVEADTCLIEEHT